jgi:hypothetical protein
MKKTINYLLVALILISCGKSHEGSHSSVRLLKGSLIADTSATWENNHTLIVTYLDGTPDYKAEVERFSQEWAKYANINFAFYSNIDDLPYSKNADVVISFNDQGNNSFIGKDSRSLAKKGKKTMNLSIFKKEENINERRFIVLHEFGHALGLAHEHLRTDRNFYLDENKAYEYCEKIFHFGKEMCLHNMINTISGSKYYLSTYDPQSIMHYSLHPGFFDNKFSLRNNKSLSLLDKIEIAKIYPGRISEEEIIADHKLLVSEVDEMKTYKNCKINESTSTESRLNAQGIEAPTKIRYYSLSSLVPGEYKNPFAWEDKEGLVFLLKNTEYCNLEGEDLKNYREKIYAGHLANNDYGNCTIPLNSDGTPQLKGCTNENPYSILKRDHVTHVDNFCYPLFQVALEKLKSNKYCTLPTDELIEKEKMDAAQFEVDRKYGKCFVENTKNINQAQCPKGTSWTILKIKSKNTNIFCFSDSKIAINYMRKDRECRP